MPVMGWVWRVSARALTAPERARWLLVALLGASLACSGAERAPSGGDARGRGAAQRGSPPVATQNPSSDSPCGHQGDAEPPALAGITAAHNALRCRVTRPTGGVLAPLSWSAHLAAGAQRYADAIKNGGCNLQHSKTEHGENLFGGTGKYSAQAVVERWAGEAQCFRYASFPACCSCTCGHYTQLVWADSQRLGCGMATCADGSEVWVCHYDPAGNFMGTPPY